MAKKSKFNKMVENSDKNTAESDRALTKRVTKQAIKNVEKNRKRVERLANTKVDYSSPYLEDYDEEVTQQPNPTETPQETSAPIKEAEVKVEPIKKPEPETKTEKVDLSELKQVQDEIRREKGEPIEPEQEPYVPAESEATENQSAPIDSTSTAENEETANEGNVQEQPSAEQNTDAEPTDENESNPKIKEVESDDEDVQVIEMVVEPTEPYHNEEIDKRLEENSNLSKVDDEEIAKIKREIALEKGLISVDDVVEENEKNANLPENDEKTDENQPNEEIKDEKQAQVDYEDDGFYEETKPKKEVVRDSSLPPDESLPDDITNEEIEKLLKEQEQEELRKEELAEEESYEGMTEEEIAEAKERKRKFAELKQKYNSGEIGDDGEMGDYKKNLDFTVNTSIKRFKLKPPKKPFIITGVVLVVLAIVSVLITYFVLNRPAAPVQLVSINLSVESVDEFVGEELDLSGVKIIKRYSNGNGEIVDATDDLISYLSDNIDKSTKIITEYSSDTIVEFTIDGHKAILQINLTEIQLGNLYVSINQEIKSGQVLRFDKMYLYSLVTYQEANNSTAQQEMRIDPSEASLFINGVEMAKDLTAGGFIISPEIYGGNITLEFRFSGKSATIICQIVKA